MGDPWPGGFGGYQEYASIRGDSGWRRLSWHFSTGESRTSPVQADQTVNSSLGNEALDTKKRREEDRKLRIARKDWEGGMGVVYMAEQEQPVRRRVALKIIKLGMGEATRCGRF